MRPIALFKALPAIAMLALLACSDSGPGLAAGPNSPPRNPFLADSDYSLGHAESAQQDSSPIAGPRGPSETLLPADISYQPIGPGHFGLGVSSPYPPPRPSSNSAAGVVRTGSPVNSSA